MSVGTQIAGYRLEEEIGRGGMGVVYRAHDLRSGAQRGPRSCSPQQLAEDPDFRERFLVESRLAASLDHPNVVPVYDAGEVEGQLYLAMRYVEGTDLKRLLAQEGTLEPARAIAICSQIANALDAAHARGLVHRDVKPSNVLLDEREHAYLADFGLTRRLSDQAPDFDAGLSLGTPAYVAPEQIEGKDVDGRADQYSLACLLHECLTGSLPSREDRRRPRSLRTSRSRRPPRPASRTSCDGAREVARRPLRIVHGVRGRRPSRARPGAADACAGRWRLPAFGAALLGAALLAFFLDATGRDERPSSRNGLARSHRSHHERRGIDHTCRPEPERTLPSPKTATCGSRAATTRTSGRSIRIRTERS